MADFRFRSLADIEARPRNVRFTPNSGHRLSVSGCPLCAGQWCGDVTDYVFTPDMLTVKFHDSRPANVFKITKYTYTNNSVRIDWLTDAGKESVTVFAEFVGNSTAMAQQQNGDKPRRSFHRC